MAQRVGPRRVVGPKFRAFFRLPPTSFALFLTHCVSSRGFLVVFGSAGECARLELTRSAKRLAKVGLAKVGHDRTPFHPKQTLFLGVTFLQAHPLPATPFQCPRSRTATLGEGAAATYLPLRWPDCTLSRLRAEEYDRPVTRSDAGRPLEP